MPSAQPTLRSPALGSLTIALILHALAIGAAAWLGFSLPPARDDAPDTFELRLSPPRPPPAEPAFAEPVAEVLEAVLPVADDDFLAEPELIASEVWDAPPEPELVAASDVPPRVEPDFTPPDLFALELGNPGRGKTSEPDAAGGSARVGVGSLGVIAGAGGTAQGESGSGAGAREAGTGAGANTDSGVAPRAVVILEVRPVDTPPPPYPPLARRAGEQGSVNCLLNVSEKGLVTKVEVIESSGFPRLDEAARAAVLRWRFEPRRVAGRPVASTVTHRVMFCL